MERANDKGAALRQRTKSTNNIVLQELEESALWLELLQENNMADAEELTQLRQETDELISIFVTSLKTLHNR